MKIKEIEINIGNFFVSPTPHSYGASESDYNNHNNHNNNANRHHDNYVTFFIFKNKNNDLSGNIDSDHIELLKLNVVVLFNEKYYNTAVMNKTDFLGDSNLHQDNTLNNLGNHNNSYNYQISSCESSPNTENYLYQKHETIPLQNNEFIKSIIVSINNKLNYLIYNKPTFNASMLLFLQYFLLLKKYPIVIFLKYFLFK